MKNYSELAGRIFDYLEIVTTSILAVLMCACVYFAFYFAVIMLSTPNGQDARSTSEAGEVK